MGLKGKAPPSGLTDEQFATWIAVEYFEWSRFNDKVKGGINHVYRTLQELRETGEIKKKRECEYCGETATDACEHCGAGKG